MITLKKRNDANCTKKDIKEKSLIPPLVYPLVNSFISRFTKLKFFLKLKKAKDTIKDKRETLKEDKDIISLEFWGKPHCPKCSSTMGFSFHFNPFFLDDILPIPLEYPNQCKSCGYFCNVFGECVDHKNYLNTKGEDEKKKDIKEDLFNKGAK